MGYSWAGALPLHPAQGSEPSAGINREQHSLSPSPEGCNDWNQRRQLEDLHLAGERDGVSGVALMKSLVGLLKGL